MKQALLLLFFISLNATSQTFSQTIKVDADKIEIFMKDGSKIIAAGNYFDVSSKGKSIGYKLPDGKWEKRADVDKMDYAIVGDYKFKSFGNRGYFVLAEQNGKYLACQEIHSHSSTATFYKYTIMIFDEKNKKGDEYERIDEIIFTRLPTKGRAIDRGKVPEFVAKYFGNCEEINKRFEKHLSDADELNLRVCEICDEPVFKPCN